MRGTTLVELRERIEALESDEGTYYVACGRTGERPIPAAGKRFETRATARRAARATRRYRSVLRQYDPRLPFYDLIVRDEAGLLDGDPNDPERDGTGSPSSSVAVEPSPKSPAADCEESRDDRRPRIEFCHRVAAAVFETLSEGGYEGVEMAVMDAYFDHAESVADPDDLCLCLLESMAAELDERLVPAEQAEVVAGAASRLDVSDRGRPGTTPDDPLAGALATLGRRGLIGDYALSRSADGTDGDPGSVRADVSEYALSPVEGRLPALPLVVELRRRDPEERLPRVGVRDGDDWQFAIDLGGGAGPDASHLPKNLSCVPIRTR